MFLGSGGKTTTRRLMNKENDVFGEVIFSYTRKQAIEDGMQVDVSKTASEAGIRFPTFLTRSVFDAFVRVPHGVEGQDEAGRLWDILWMLRFAIKRADDGTSRISFDLLVRNDNRKPKRVGLFAVCGALDIDDAQPSVTIMMPDED
jgi:hypothetical protein